MVSFPQPNLVDVPGQTVSLRSAWADSWTPNTALHCTELRLTAAESISQATFHHPFGERLPSGGSSWAAQAVATFNPRLYVRVQIDGTDGRTGFDWYGVWATAEKGDDRQQFVAVGMESLLDVPCVDAAFLDFDDAVSFAGRGLAFNAGGRPNRSADLETVNGELVYVFEPDASAAEYWSTRDAVNYLVAMAAQKDAGGTIIWNWQMTGGTNLPAFDRVSEFATDGRTFLEMLRALIPRYRLLGWHVDNDGTDPRLNIWTFADADIDITDIDDNVVGTIPANAAQIDIDTSADGSATSRITTAAQHVVDQVIATGDPRISVFSLNQNRDLTVEARWSVAQQSEYRDPSVFAADWPDADQVREIEERLRDARNADSLRGVFALFGPPDGWDQRAGDADGGAQTAIFWTDDDPPAQFKVPENFEFETALPLLSGYDYGGTIIADAEAADTAGHRGDVVNAVDPHEPLPPIVFARYRAAADDEFGKDRWLQGDQFARSADLEIDDDVANRKFSLSVRPTPGAAAWECRVHGAPQHAIAATEFSAEPDAVFNALTWESLIFTLAVRDTRRAESRYPADADVTPLGEIKHVLRVVAPGHRYVDVRPGTVVGVDPWDDTLLRSTGGLLEDDRPTLRLIAQRLYQWHRVPRYALQLSTGWVDGAVALGNLVTESIDQSGTWPVNAAVTSIVITLPVVRAESAPEAPTAKMSIATAFAEIDGQRL